MTSSKGEFKSAIFLTFSGNCKEALSFYQTCFGGTLQFETFEKELPGYKETPVVSGSLIADDIIIHGSDLVHNEGRIIGNYMAIFISCANADARKALIEKLELSKHDSSTRNDDDQLIELIDAFEVRWVLGV
ncbi:VOC family protein [Pedobacter frigiditerrae]|nr:glyoxalase [Pedobacter frigiditerrae]